MRALRAVRAVCKLCKLLGHSAGRAWNAASLQPRAPLSDRLQRAACCTHSSGRRASAAGAREHGSPARACCTPAIEPNSGTPVVVRARAGEPCSMRLRRLSPPRAACAGPVLGMHTRTAAVLLSCCACVMLLCSYIHTILHCGHRANNPKRNEQSALLITWSHH